MGKSLIMRIICAKSMSSLNTREQDIVRIMDMTQAECDAFEGFHECGIYTCSETKEDQVRR
jgi:hypothetical protein